jgi:hypothetical protein
VTSGSAAGGLDKYDLYELAVQDSARMARFLRAVHGGAPRVLREDFSGPGGLCRAWVGAGVVGGARTRGVRAVAVDIDPEPLAKLAGVKGVRAVCADVRRAADRAHDIDVIAALNFPVGYWHTRRDLVKYLKLSLSRLARGGIFACDMYGGVSAFRVVRQRRVVVLPRGVGGRSGGSFVYEWEQREVDVVRGRVKNAIHFRVPRGVVGDGARGGARGGAPARGRAGSVVLRDAFTYDWRLWSIAELREAMLAAGFASVEVHDRLGGAVDGEGNLHVRPLGVGDELDRDWVVYVVGRR